MNFSFTNYHSERKTGPSNGRSKQQHAERAFSGGGTFIINKDGVLSDLKLALLQTSKIMLQNKLLGIVP